MPLPSLPVHGLDDINHRRRSRETINNILNHQFDDSKVRTSAEISAGVTPVNYAYPPGDVRRYGAKGDGVTDDTIALQSCAAVVNASGNGKIEFAPDGNYIVWVGSSPDLIALTDCVGVVIEGNGATLTSGRTNGPGVFAIGLDNCERTRIRGLKLQGSNTTLTHTTGEGLVQLTNGSPDTVIENCQTKNANTFLQCGNGSSPPLTGRVSGIAVINARAEDTYYGIACSGDGDNLRGNIRGINTGRVYFPWNVKNHEISIDGQQEGPFSDVLIKCYGYASSSVYSACENIRVAYRTRGKSAAAQVNVAADSLVHLELQLAASGGGAGALRDIDVDLRVDCPSGAQSAELNRVFNITKLDAAGATDTSARGHVINNIHVHGTVTNFQNAGAHSDVLPPFMIFDNSSGMNWTGEFATNIEIGPLVIEDTTVSPAMAGIFINGQPFISGAPGLNAHDISISNFDLTKVNWSAAFQWTERRIKASTNYKHGRTSYTPTITGSTTDPTLGSSTLTGFYSRDGDDVEVDIRLSVTTGGSWNAGSGAWFFALPVVPRTDITVMGSGVIIDNGSTQIAIMPETLTDGTARARAWAHGSASLIGAASPITWATSDEIRIRLRYKA